LRKIHTFYAGALFFFTLTLATSCTAQKNTREPKEAQVKHAMLVKTQGTGPQDNVFCALRDKSGNLWFGTTGEGVYRYDGKSFTNYTTQDGLNANAVFSMLEDKSGNIVLGTGKGICRYDGKSFLNLTQNTPLRYSAISAMLEDKNGRLWVCDYKLDDQYFLDGKGGIYLYDPTSELENEARISYLLDTDSLKNTREVTLLRVNGISEDAEGNIWFAGQNGDNLVRYDGTSLEKHTFTGQFGESNYKYRSMLLDKTGRLWLGTHFHGVLQYDPAASTNENVLPAGRVSFVNYSEHTALEQACVMSILEDKNGNLWFCTDGNGVWRYDGVTLKNFTTQDGLLNNAVFSAVEDTDGNIWFGTRNTGLCRWDGVACVGFSEE
jgi:ligand-binding sensor domain-containing protein